MRSRIAVLGALLIKLMMEEGERFTFGALVLTRLILFLFRVGLTSHLHCVVCVCTLIKKDLFEEVS